MLTAETSTRRLLAEVALGNTPADMVIRGGKVIEVHTGAVVDADVAIKGQRIAYVGDASHTVGRDTRIIDATGHYLSPGFIDCHIHVGGSQLTMTELARLLIPHGTAAISTCFYEAGTIGGWEAIQFFLEEARHTPLKVLFSPFLGCYLGLGMCGNPGRFDAADVPRMLDVPECVEIREWSIYFEQVPVPALQDFIDKARRQNKVIAGHLEGQLGHVLQASVALGASSDHEVATAEEALEKARLGVRVQARQGSAAWDLDRVIRAVTEYRADPRYFMFSTDEEEAQRIDALGHMDLKVRMAIANGVSPVTAVQMATLNAAEYFRIADDLGSISPGRLAHIAFVKDLRDFTVDAVIADGQLVAEGGTYTADVDHPRVPGQLLNTMRLPEEITASDFAIPAEGSEVDVRVIAVHDGSLLTEERILPMAVTEGEIKSDPSRDVVKLCVFDRHDASGRVGKGFVHGFRFPRGAFAASVNPGLMNLMVLGTNDEDMAICANRVRAMQGGVVVALNGNVLAEVPLPILGIVSDRPSEEIVQAMRSIERALREDIGCDFEGLLTALGFTLCAIVIPSLKLCDRGLARIRRDGGEFVDLIATAPQPASPV